MASKVTALDAVDSYTRQAFPGTFYEGGDEWVDRGMSLRDYFAGQAIVGLVLHGMNEQVVLRAYAVADLMIKEGATVPDE